MRPHPRKAETNPRSPRAWATCDRCSFITNHYKLEWQFDWRGTELQNLKILVCYECVDKPQRQLGTIILPPDPVSILNARVEPYMMEELTTRLTMDGQVRYQMDGMQRIESNAQSTILLTSDAEEFLLSDGGNPDILTE